MIETLRRQGFPAAFAGTYFEMPQGAMQMELGNNVDRMSGFAAGCAATYVFVRNMVMKPAIKSCHQRIVELTEDRDRLIRRVEQLETILMTRNPNELAAAVQASLSENHIEIEILKRKVEGKA